MPYTLPPGFDPESDDWQQHNEIGSIEDIAEEFEWETWEDILLEDGEYNLQNVRPFKYLTAQEAVNRLADRKLIGFSGIIYSPVTDYWQIVVADTSGGSP